jgi:acetyl-CoA carboxylase carboxyltransferase component
MAMNRKGQIDELVAKLQAQTSQAQVRLKQLFDENSFVEIGACNKSAGVVTGYGAVDGRLVYAFCQEGPVSIMHAKKIANIYNLALKMGAPIVGVLDSEGVSIDEGVDVLEAYGTIFSAQSSASGVIPQISIVAGKCLGVASFVPIISDFVIMTENNAQMFMTSPAVFHGLEGKATSYEELGGAETLNEEGIIHRVAADEQDAIKQARELIGFLPQNNLEGIVADNCVDDLNREDEGLNGVVPEGYVEPINIRAVLSSVADNNHFFELQDKYGDSIITGFMKLGGITVGVIANNGELRADACKKAGELVGKCDAFHIPVVTFTDIIGYEHTLETEQRGIIKYGARLLSYFASATVPKINVILRNGIGNAYLLMNSKHIGADVVYAWPSARVALLEEKAATNVIGIDSDRYVNSTNPYAVAGKGYVDSVILPSATRKRLISAVMMLATKRENAPVRKHSSIEY